MKRGQVVAVCGPDGVGKTTIVERFSAIHSATIIHMHHRPGLIPYPTDVDGAVNVTRPHDLSLHSPTRSLLKVLYLYVDWLMAWLFVIAPHRRRGGWVLIQRPWWDMLIDPRRYRLDTTPSILRSLGRLLPKPDLTVLLEASPSTVVSRKSELSTAEIRRQTAEWRRIIDSVGGVVVDVNGSIEESLQELATVMDQLTTLRELGQHISLQEGRWLIPRHPRQAATTAMTMYQPTGRGAWIRWWAGKLFAYSGVLGIFPSAKPPPDLFEAIESYVPLDGTFAAHQLRCGQGWFVLVIGNDHNPVVALKVALSSKATESLEREVEVLRGVSELLRPPVAVPFLRDYRDGVMVVDPVMPRPRRHPLDLPHQLAAELGYVFRQTRIENEDSTRGTIHGDFVPWHVLWNGRTWYLVDWEDWQPDGLPFYDVLHYFVQTHTLFGQPTSREILNGLRGQGYVAEAIKAFALAADFDPEVARPTFLLYLEKSSEALDKSAFGYEKAVASRRALMTLWLEEESKVDH